MRQRLDQVRLVDRVHDVAARPFGPQGLQGGGLAGRVPQPGGGGEFQSGLVRPNGVHDAVPHRGEERVLDPLDHDRQRALGGDSSSAVASVGAARAAQQEQPGRRTGTARLSRGERPATTVGHHGDVRRP